MGRKIVGGIAVVAGIGLVSLSGCAPLPEQPGVMPHIVYLRGQYPSPSSLSPAAPMVTLVHLTEVIASEKYRSDPTYFGPRFVGDLPRTDAVRGAILAHLEKAGVAAEYRPEAIQDGRPAAVDRPFQLSVQIRQFEVLQESPFKLKAVVALGCQLARQGDHSLLWQGSAEGTDDKLLVVAIDQAVDNCVKPAVEFVQRGRRETYVKLLEMIKTNESSGNRSQALTLYAQAYRVALGPEQKGMVLDAMGRLLRTSSPLPSLPEEARRLAVQAGVLVQEQRYQEGLAKYAAALDLAPWWPEAHFNSALLLADQARFPEATTEMKAFLELAPGSPDARAAQDKIYEWELKIK